MFVDTHCHLSEEDYDDIDLVIKENRANNIEKIVISGCSESSILESIKYAKKYNDVFLTLGFHPEYASIINDSDIKTLEKIITNNKKVVGIGEIGLDYHYKNDNREKQISLFEKQLQLAEKLKLPVVIHSRDATKDTIDILKKYDLKGIIHCFNGSVETANIYMSMGYKLGIGGVITFKNSKLFQVIEKIGLDNIVLETDSPYLAPEPVRGKKNSSKYIPYIAEFIANICHCDITKVAKITSNNAYQVFDLN